MKRLQTLATLLLCMLLPIMTEPALAIVYVHDQNPAEVGKGAKRQDRQQKADFLLEKFFKKSLPNEQTDLEKMAGSAFRLSLAGFSGLIIGSILGVLGIAALGTIGGVFALLALIVSIAGLIVSIGGMVKGSYLLENFEQSLSHRAHIRAKFAKASGWVLMGLYILSFIAFFRFLIIVLV